MHQQARVCLRSLDALVDTREKEREKEREGGKGVRAVCSPQMGVSFLMALCTSPGTRPAKTIRGQAERIIDS